MGGMSLPTSAAPNVPLGHGAMPPPAPAAAPSSGSTHLGGSNPAMERALALLGQQRPGGPAPGTGPKSTNVAQRDPNIDALMERYNSRFGSDNTQRATERAVGGIADAAALLTHDAQAGLAARGATGSGVAAAHIKKNITDPALRAATGAATDIALGEQDRQDRLTLGGLGIASAAGDAARADRNLALQQYQTDAQLAQAQNQQQMAQLMAFMNMMSSM